MDDKEQVMAYKVKMVVFDDLCRGAETYKTMPMAPFHGMQIVIEGRSYEVEVVTWIDSKPEFIEVVFVFDPKGLSVNQLIAMGWSPLQDVVEKDSVEGRAELRARAMSMIAQLDALEAQYLDTKNKRDGLA